MSFQIRILLLLGAIGTLWYFLSQIRKKRLQIDYAISWSFFSIALVFLGLFPGVAIQAAKLLEVQSPVNLIFLVIIFILILKQFSTTTKLSHTNQQVQRLTQYIALQQMELQQRPPLTENSMRQTDIECTQHNHK